LHYRWLHPITLALYNFFYHWETQEEETQEDLLEWEVRAFTEKSTPEEFQDAIAEIEAELSQPTQTLSDILPNSRRTEAECRGFLEELLASLKAR